MGDRAGLVRVLLGALFDESPAVRARAWLCLDQLDLSSDPARDGAGDLMGGSEDNTTSEETSPGVLLHGLNAVALTPVPANSEAACPAEREATQKVALVERETPKPECGRSISSNVTGSHSGEEAFSGDAEALARLYAALDQLSAGTSWGSTTTDPEEKGSVDEKGSEQEKEKEKETAKAGSGLQRVGAKARKSILGLCAWLLPRLVTELSDWTTQGRLAAARALLALLLVCEGEATSYLDVLLPGLCRPLADHSQAGDNTPEGRVHALLKACTWVSGFFCALPATLSVILPLLEGGKINKRRSTPILAALGYGEGSEAKSSLGPGEDSAEDEVSAQRRKALLMVLHELLVGAGLAASPPLQTQAPGTSASPEDLATRAALYGVVGVLGLPDLSSAADPTLRYWVLAAVRALLVRFPLLLTQPGYVEDPTTGLRRSVLTIDKGSDKGSTTIAGGAWLDVPVELLSILLRLDSVAASEHELAAVTHAVGELGAALTRALQAWEVPVLAYGGDLDASSKKPRLSAGVEALLTTPALSATQVYQKLFLPLYLRMLRGGATSLAYSPTEAFASWIPRYNYYADSRSSSTNAGSEMLLVYPTGWDCLRAGGTEEGLDVCGAGTESERGGHATAARAGARRHQLLVEHVAQAADALARRVRGAVESMNHKRYDAKDMGPEGFSTGTIFALSDGALAHTLKSLFRLFARASTAVPEHMPHVFPLLAACSHIDSTASERGQALSLVLHMLADQQRLQPAFPEAFVVQVVSQIVLPNLAWRAGRVAEALRIQAVFALHGLFHERLVTSRMAPALAGSLLPSLRTSLEDEEASIRLKSSQIYRALFSLPGLSVSMDEIAVTDTHREFLKRLDDSSDDVRRDIAGTFLVFYKEFMLPAALPRDHALRRNSLHSVPDGYDYNGQHYRYFVKSFLVHLDDPDTSVANTMFAVLQDPSILRLHSEMFIDEVLAIRPRHRSPLACDRLLELAEQAKKNPF